MTVRLTTILAREPRSNRWVKVLIFSIVAKPICHFLLRTLPLERVSHSHRLGDRVAESVELDIVEFLQIDLGNED